MRVPELCGSRAPAGPSGWGRPGSAARVLGGGLAVVLRDGRLSYARETIVETYYSYKVSRTVTLSPDLQVVANPGYNSDRGPAKIASLRLHYEF